MRAPRAWSLRGRKLGTGNQEAPPYPLLRVNSFSWRAAPQAGAVLNFR